MTEPSAVADTEQRPANEPRGPLDGVRVLNIGGHLSAGHSTALLADFGADVIAIEMPGKGDALRGMGPFSDGKSLRWVVVGRGKRSITADLHTEEGQELVRELVRDVDVVVENYRPGTVARWGLAYEDLRAINPRIIMLSISGYGQTGPSSYKPGFGRVLEAVSGLMNSTGMPDGPPMQIGVPVVDYITGTLAAMAVSMALYHRDVHPDGEGQHIDVSLYETVVRLLDALITRYDVLGDVPMRMGNRYPNVVPSDVYRTRDGRYVFHSSAAQTIFERLAKAIGREDMLTDERYATNLQRIERIDEVNDIVQAWFSEHDYEDVIRIMDEHGVPVGPVNTMKEVAHDPHLLERETLVRMDVEGIGPVLMPGLVPKFSRTPGRIRHPGPSVGQHDAEFGIGE
ncbi:MAG TPA: CoA transferase [Solirubrobacteraceae bacterium]|nr:CoA transferase [Solirubrobacteraceae bacterium]